MAVPGSQTQMVPIPSVSVPASNVSSNSFSFPLHNVFDRFSPDELPLPRPVLEIVSPVAHTDVHPVEVMRSHQTLWEELVIPTVNDATYSLLDDVEHDHVSPRELVESPKGAYESVPHASPVEHDGMNEVSAEFFRITRMIWLSKRLNILVLEAHHLLAAPLFLMYLPLWLLMGLLMVTLKMTLAFRMVQRYLLLQRFTLALEFNKTWNYGAELRSMIKELQKSLLFLC